MSNPSAVPAQIAGYRVESVLGSGAMSTVYLVRHPSLPRREVLKVLAADLVADPASRSRFEHDADMAAMLEHPNIVQIFGRGTTDEGQPWIAMEYVGPDAEAVLRRGAVHPRRACRIVSEVAAALDYAHSRGVVHGDVKPSNFLLAEDGRVVLTDFGAAVNATPTEGTAPPAGSTVTSMAYAAPEVILGQRQDARSDVYALGCSLFRLLTGGQYPFPVDHGRAALARAHLEQDPPSLSELLPWANPVLDEVIGTALAKSPADRYRSAGEFAAAAIRAVETPAAPPPPAAPPLVSTRLPPPPPAAGGLRRPGWLDPAIQTVRSIPPAVLAAVAAAVAAVGLVVVLWPSPSSGPPAQSVSSSATTTVAPPSAAEWAELKRLLPPGYAPGVCTRTSPAEGSSAVAAMECPGNTDLAGSTARYSLARSPAAIREDFNRTSTEAGTSTVMCPGNIQSPGAWHRVVTPSEPVGMLWCGLRDGHPVIAWTLDANMFMGTIESANPTGMDELFTWWASHS